MQQFLLLICACSEIAHSFPHDGHLKSRTTTQTSYRPCSIQPLALQMNGPNSIHDAYFMTLDGLMQV